MIMDILGSDHVNYIAHDSYYKDLSHLDHLERGAMNFDHPDALETQLLVEHIKLLKQGSSVRIPEYDYTDYTRVSGGEIDVEPRRIILLDGILLFSEPELLALIDLKLYVDTDDDLRLLRRIQRDVSQRGRSVDSILSQYEQTVRPMHIQFVEPSKRHADIIVPAANGIQEGALNMCVSRLREIINM
jgi:uridine kinase